MTPRGSGGVTEKILIFVPLDLWISALIHVSEENGHSTTTPGTAVIRNQNF
jgi:hypothetical protein